MKHFIAMALMLVGTSLLAEKVEVTADKFFADETKKTSIFEGKVSIVKGYDTLNAQKVVIEFDDKKQPLRYIATGNAKVNMKMSGKKYYGEAEKMTYEPTKNLYTLEKKAFLHEIETDKKVYGDFIKADQSNGQYEVDGKGKAPVKFIFTLEDEKK